MSDDEMMNHIGTQMIETERLILRRFEYADIDSMLRNWISDEKTQYDYGELYYTTPEAVRNLFDTKYIVSYTKDDYYRWAVIEKCGLTCEGCFRDFFWRKDHYEGRMVFSILKEEYEEKGRN
jgi:ribosomal-protein-alanine N-acetyltransferase